MNVLRIELIREIGNVKTYKITYPITEFTTIFLKILNGNFNNLKTM